MARRWVLLAAILAVLFGWFSSVSGSPTGTAPVIFSPHSSSLFRRFRFVAEIIAGVLSKAVSALVNWIWAINSVSKIGSIRFLSPNFERFFFCVFNGFLGIIYLIGFSAVSTRSMIKFETGYVVETVFDGSKLGIEPYSVGVSPSGDLLILDAENSNVHKITMPFSQCKSSCCTNLSVQLCSLDYISSSGTFIMNIGARIRIFDQQGRLFPMSLLLS